MMYSTREISPDAMWKPAGNKGKYTEGQCTETLDSAQKHNWVVGSQILTPRAKIKHCQLNSHLFEAAFVGLHRVVFFIYFYLHFFSATHFEWGRKPIHIQYN